jgi:signal transduction histidine kinase/ligand-binding sensor domain-containing protein
MSTRFICMLLVAWGATSSAWALDPSERLSQYGHTSWRGRDGYFGGGSPTSIAQTQDGFLWIATSTGLARFDGVRFTPWSPPDGQSLPVPIGVLVAARDGSLWMGAVGNVIQWHSGHLTRYAIGPFSVNSMLEARDGTVWFTRSGGGKPGSLCRVEQREPHCYGASDGIDDQFPSALAEDATGSLWVGGDSSVIRWTPSLHVRYPLPALRSKVGKGVSSLVPAPDGSLWVGIFHTGPNLGLVHLATGQLTPITSGKIDGSALPVQALYVDVEGSLWIATGNQGLYRLHGETVDRFGATDGLSGDFVRQILEDREGTLWVLTTRGLDAFRDLRVVTLSNREGLSLTEVDSAHAARDGTVWLGEQRGLDAIHGTEVTHIPVPGSQVTAVLQDHTGALWVGIDSSLTLLRNGRFEPIPLPDPNPKDLVTSLTEDLNNSIWAEVRGRTAKLIRIEGGRVQAVFPESRIPPATELASDRESGIWLGLRSGDLARLRNGALEVFPFNHRSAGSVGPAPIAQITIEDDGSVLAAANFGLLGWHQGTRQLMTVRNGLPCDDIYGVIQDEHGAVWLATPCALLRLAPGEINAWWRDPTFRVHPTVLDSFDGWEPSPVSFQPSARSADGRLWFASRGGVQIFDPEHPIHNTVLPPVYIEGLIADHKPMSLNGGARLPPHTSNVQLSYTALSMVVPQKVHFRYRLEGHDSDWQDVGTRREAFYNDLPPGNYRFRVIASNNDGVWNEAGDSLSFSIVPAWYQTNPARATALVLGFLIFWLLYRMRARQIEANIWSRFNERLAERLRVARDIHDTLLQTIQGSKLVADHAVQHAADTAQLRTAMEQLAGWLARAIHEGRAAVNSLRASTAEGHDLLESLKRAAQTEAGTSSLAVTVASSGAPRELHPVVADEVSRIAHEAIRNTLLHSGAGKLVMELEFGERLILRITDDGIGMETAVLEHGRLGHFGLPGMRERAARIGGKLTITSAPGAGTVVTLIVPGGLAFQSTQPNIFRALRVFRRTGTED